MSTNFKFTGDYKIGEEESVKVIKYDAEKSAKIVKAISNGNHLKNFKRLNADEYYDKKEKKVKKYKKNKYRTTSGIQNSMRKAKDYLRNNFNGGKNESFLTLTYETEMMDMEKLKQDFKNFWEDLKKQYQDLEYFYVVEIQEERESLHIHALIKDTKHKKLYIPHEEIYRLWNKGNIWVSKITNRDTKEIVIKENKNDKKAIDRVIKYMTKSKTKEKIPRDKNLYSKSRGITLPTITKTKQKEAELDLKDNGFVFEYGYAGYLLTRKSGYVVATIKGQVYKKKE